MKNVDLEKVRRLADSHHRLLVMQERLTSILYSSTETTLDWTDELERIRVQQEIQVAMVTNWVLAYEQSGLPHSPAEEWAYQQVCKMLGRV